MNAMKCCCQCGEIKLATEFPKHKRSKDGYGYSCKACNNETLRKYRKTERWLQWRRDYYNRNIEKERKNAIESRNRHLEQQRQADIDYYWRNPEKRRAISRKWRQDYPDKFKESTNRRRSREIAAPGSFTAKEWRLLQELYNFTCLCCEKHVPEISLTPDHVIPLSKGGSNDIDNIQPLCLACNKRKMTKSTDYRTKFLKG